ncbi:hypothetical protein [Nonomuraea zeae]|uniref:WXG100 family type VII secretion target n=1 Tax=Nonomuraea zeae TaxID=1642303 RepID=A0A5S4FVN9_9ACTN|nr:hypothetical protein [Nonomuraea zeae]TMR24835.1 hypothetical protein ETD85_46050 [Nonomuraea zeae]
MPGPGDDVPVAPPVEPIPDGTDGYAARTDKIIAFADVMLEAAETVHKVKAKVPVVEDWGWFDTPRIISPFLDRLNGYIGEWTSAAGLLEQVLKDDGPKLIGVAKRYRDVDEGAKAAINKIKL